MKIGINHKLGFSAIVLLISGVVCKSLGALFRLPLTNLLGIEGIGVFQLVMSLYSFALVLTSGGIATSLSKLISAARARGQRNTIGYYLKYSLFVSGCVGILIGLLFLLFGKRISLLQGIEHSQSYSLFVFLLPIGAVVAGFRGFFQGYSNMLPTAISQIFEQVFKFVFGLVFAFYFSNMGVFNGVFGAFLGIALSEVVTVIFLFLVFVSKSREFSQLKTLQEVKFARKEFLSANIPLTISASILPLVSAFEGLFIIPRLAVAGFANGFATKLFGLQTGIVGAILNFPLIISMAVTTALLPNLSFMISKGLAGKQMIEKGLKMLLFLLLPTTFGVVAVCKQIFELVYADMNGQILNVAFSLMFFGAFSIVFTSLMQFFLMLLQANGQFRFVMLITLMGGILKANISFFLSAVPQINIFALVLGNLSLSSVVCLLALVKLKKTVPLTMPFSYLFMLIFATMCMFFVVYTFINSNYFSSFLNLILAVALGVVVYVVFTIPVFVEFLTRKKRKGLKVNV